MSNNIKALRRRTGKGQREVADALGVKLDTYRSWEQQKRSPTGAMGIKIAQYFGTTTDTVFGSQFSESLPPTPDESDLLSDYRGLSDVDKSAVRSFAAFLSSRNKSD